AQPAVRGAGRPEGVGAEQSEVLPDHAGSGHATDQRSPQESPVRSDTLTGCMYQDLFLYFAVSKVTSDFMVDAIEQWWSGIRPRFPKVRTLLINQDNGPENHSRRTQFMKRIVGFGQSQGLTIRLAYYPPY